MLIHYEIDDIRIIEADVYGSRLYGDNTEKSDLDIVVEYSGDMHEDNLFNILNEEKFVIDGIEVDINPIRKEETGCLKDFMKRHNKQYKEYRNEKSSMIEAIQKNKQVLNNKSRIKKEKHYEFEL